MPRSPTRRQSAFWLAATVSWLAVIGWCTLRSAPDQVAEIAKLRWYCVVCGDSGIADVILNVLLFLPLGLALRGMGWSIWRTVFTAMAISTAIEITQGTLLVGRDACIGDVMSNTLGGALGWVALAGVRAFIRPTRRVARNGSVAILAITTLLWLGTGAGLQPSLTDDIPWIGQPMHEGRGKQPFPGTLQRAAMNGVRIPNEEMTQKPAWRDSIVFEIDATRENAQLFADASVMLRIVDTAHVVQTGIDQIGDDARLRLRVRAANWLLHNPRWRVSHAMRMTPGTPWRFRWSWQRDRFSIVNEPIAGPAAPAIVVPLSIGLGWAFIHPFVSIISDTRLLWTALWLGWWFGLLGWLAGRLGARAGMLIGCVAAVIFVGASIWSGFAIQWSEVGSGALAFVVAAVVATRRGSQDE